MQMDELNLNMIIYKNPLLINALDRSVNHPLLRKYPHIRNILIANVTFLQAFFIIISYFITNS